MRSEKLDLDAHIRRDNIRRYVLQCSLAGLVVLMLLLILDSVTQTVLIAALGASAFIAFAVPRSLHSGPRHLIGGYVVGMFAGCLMGSMDNGIDLSSMTLDHAVTIVFGALAIATAMFLMVVTKTEHPPAAALALGLVLNEWTLLTLVVILTGVIGLSLVKRVVLPVLMDLL
jgi:CBS-domain-containing membrane protein